MSRTVIRPGEPADFEPAIFVWRAANARRKNGLPVTPEHEKRVRNLLCKPDAFLLVAEDGGELVGMAVGVQGRTREGEGSPIEGLCHISMIFIAPDHWGKGIGGQLVESVLAGARSAGYDRVQLWTQTNNPRAQRLYEGRGFIETGRRKYEEELGELIMHYARPL